MNCGLSVNIKAQQGFSLLNIMIALVVSAASSLASISLYTNHQAATKSVKEAATLNRRVATSMVVLQNEITSAGYGIEDAGSDDVVVLNVPATATTAAEISLLWRYQDGGVVTCRGVHEYGTTEDDTDYRVLRIIETVSGCDTSSNLVDLTWDTQKGILSQWEINDGLESYLTNNDGTLFKFQVTAASCAPFGMVRLESNSKLEATISSPNLAQINNVAGVAGNLSRICLVNTNTI